MAETQNNDAKKEEKPTDYDKRVKQYVLGLLTIIVIGLVVSMFKTSKTQKEPPKVEGHPMAEAIPATDFNKQIQFEENQLKAARVRNRSLSDNIVSTEADEEDSDWDKKEKLRVLNSRKSSFGIDTPPENTESEVTTHNGRVQTSSQQTNPLVSSQNMPTGRWGNANDIGEPGVNITGRAVDDNYAGKQQGDTVLVPTGTIVDGVIDRDIISDYTGPWEGHLIQDIYSIDNQFILFPKGTKIMGQSMHIGNVNEPIQNRMGMTVEWAVLPNGKRIDFHKNTTMDLAGVPAFEGDVNRHFMAQFLGVTAYALISAEAPRDSVNQNGFVQPTFSGQLADGYRAAMIPFVMKYLSLVPTVTLHAGMPIKIHTQDDMYIKPWARVNTTVYSTDN